MIFYGGGQEDVLKKVIRTVIRTNKIDGMIKQTNNFQDGVKKRRTRKCQKTNGHILTFDINIGEEYLNTIYFIKCTYFCQLILKCYKKLYIMLL